MAAREGGIPKKEEPPIPALPPEMAEAVSRLYIDLFERITGEKF